MAEPPFTPLITGADYPQSLIDALVAVVTAPLVATVDIPYFVRLLAASISLPVQQKVQFIEALSTLSQDKCDEAQMMWRDEVRQFTALTQTEWPTVAEHCAQTWKNAHELARYFGAALSDAEENANWQHVIQTKFAPPNQHWLVQAYNLQNAYDPGAQLKAGGERIRALAPQLGSGVSEADIVEYACELNDHSIDLAEFGQYSEAFTFAEQAVALFRSLVAQTPTRFETLLAGSLSNLSHRYRNRGLRAEALNAAEESVSIGRVLETSASHPLGSHFAMHLIVLAKAYREYGLPFEALKIVEESVAILRALDAHDGDRYKSDLAESLDALSEIRRERGSPEEALTASEESATIYLRLVSQAPHRFEQKFANSLDCLCANLHDCDRHAEALAVAKAAVTIRRRLAKSNPARFDSALATALNNLSAMRYDRDRDVNALGSAEEAVTILRRLSTQEPARYEAELAMSLNNLAISRSERDLHTEALAAAEDSAELYRHLAKRTPRRYDSDLAAILTNLGRRRSMLGLNDEARAAWMESLNGMLLWPVVHLYKRWIARLAYCVNALDTASDSATLLPQVFTRLLNERDEIARFDNEQQLIAFQTQLCIVAVNRAAVYRASHPELAAALMPLVLTTLQSPDIGRWLQAREKEGTSPDHQALATLRRDMLAAKADLHSLLDALDGGKGKPELGDSADGPSSVAPANIASNAPSTALQGAQAELDAARVAFHAQRDRVIAIDPSYAAAHTPLDHARLREFLQRIADRADRQRAQQGSPSALVCLLELPSEGEPAQRRLVAAVVYHVATPNHTANQRIDVIELPGAYALAEAFDQFKPAGNRRYAGRGLTLRLGSTRASYGATDAADASTDPVALTETPAGQPFNALLTELDATLWQPIAQRLTETLGEGLVRDLGVLHIATHGRSHQFPLRSLPALSKGNFAFVQWPGVPYMRLACDTNSLACKPPEHFTNPWQIAHDCPLCQTSCRIPSKRIHRIGSTHNAAKYLLNRT